MLNEKQLLYLQEYIITAAGFDLPYSCFSPDELTLIFDVLSRKEEREIRHRDQWGNWEGSFSESYVQGQLIRPQVDELITEKVEQYLKTNPNQTVYPSYPNNHSFALCITHDIDSINYFPDLQILYNALLHFVRSGKYNHQAIRSILLKTLKELLVNKPHKLMERNIAKFVDFEQQLGYKSTVYLFAPHLLNPHFYDSHYRLEDKILFKEKRMSLAAMAQELHAAGWDIGLHGSYNSAFDKKSLQHEKQLLQDRLGFDILSTRQHWLHFDIDTTPQIHDELGFQSDSSLGFNRHIGFRSGVAHPYRIWNFRQEEAHKTWEIPLNIMDGTLFYANSLELNPELGFRHCKWIMQRVAAVRGVLTVNWHPDHLNKEPYYTLYKQILKEAAVMGAWGCSAAQLATYWNNYSRQVNAHA